MFSFLKVNVEKISIRMQALLKINSTKNDYSKHLRVESLTQIAEKNEYRSEHKTLVFVGEQREDTLKHIAESFGNNLPSPSEATGEAEIPEISEDSPAKKKLISYHQEHSEDQSVFLDRGRLLFLYQERQSMELSKDELVFLLQSSLKIDFPFWYWCIYYREKYHHVSPLLKSAYHISDEKIKSEIFYVASRFTETEEDICEMTSTENSAVVLGKAIASFCKKEKYSYAQRILSNCLSRKIVPSIEISDIENAKLPLGPAEKAVLHEIISNGWPSEVANALRLLSVSVDENDLEIVEKVLGEFRSAGCLEAALICIEKIGKSNNPTEIHKIFSDTRQEESFLRSIKVLGAIDDTEGRDLLFELYKDPWSVSWRLSDLDKWEYERSLKNSLLKHLGKEFYEKIVEDILRYETYGENWHLYTWKQTGLLRDSKNPAIHKLIKEETRIVNLSNWDDLLTYLDSIILVEAVEDVTKLKSTINNDSYRKSIFAARKLWKMIPASTVLKEKNLIENLRANLKTRIENQLETAKLQQIQRDILDGGLDSLIGENKFFNNKRKKYRANKKLSGEKGSDFNKLLDDIENFDIIEREFIKALGVDESEESKTYLINTIGTPHEELYRIITTDWCGEKIDDVASRLKGVSEDKNISLATEAIAALVRIQKIDKEVARMKILESLLTIRPKLKKNLHRDNENWVSEELDYICCINVLSEIGNPADLNLIEESINKDPVLYRIFWRYQSFWSTSTIKLLLETRDITKNENELDSIKTTLESLDHDWSEHVLGVDS
jgi:ribosomal protein S11